MFNWREVRESRLQYYRDAIKRSQRSLKLYRLWVKRSPDSTIYQILLQGEEQWLSNLKKEFKELKGQDKNNNYEL